MRAVLKQRKAGVFSQNIQGVVLKNNIVPFFKWDYPST